MSRPAKRGFILAMLSGALACLITPAVRVEATPFARETTSSKSAGARKGHAHFANGKRLARAKKWAAAAAEFRRALAAGRGGAETHYELARALFKLERKSPKALSAAREALRLDPNYAPAHALMGAILDTPETSAESIGHYKLAIRLDPQNARHHADLGNVYGKAGRSGEALAALKESIRLAPSDDYALTLLGIEYQLLGRYDESLAYLDRALRAAPRSGYALLARSQNYLYLGRAAEAASDSERYVALQGWRDSEAIFAALFGSLAHRMAGREAASRRMLDAAARHTPAANWPRPVALYLLGRLPESELFKAAGQDTDKLTEVRAYVGMDLLLRGRPGEGLPHLRWVVENGNKTFIEHRLAASVLRRPQATQD